MRLAEIERKARTLGIKDTWKYSKKDLVRNIQSAEGNFACFATARVSCEQMGCCWRGDCLK